MMCSWVTVTIGSENEKISLTSLPLLRKNVPSHSRKTPTEGIEGAGLSTFFFHLSSLGLKRSSPYRFTTTTNTRCFVVGTPTAVAFKVAVSASQPAIFS